MRESLAPPPPAAPAAAPALVAPVPVRPASARRTPERPCLNCGDATTGNYCPRCGQRKVEVRVSLRRMLLEVLDDQLALNSALPRTLLALLFRPGHLTREYVAGRIVRYIPPFRLYLASSLIFFLALSFDLSSAAAPGGALSVDVQTPEAQGGTAPPDAPRPTVQWGAGARVDTGNAALDARLRARLEEVRRMDPREAFARVGGAFLEFVPQTMFLLLPLFAGMLKVLYLGRRRFYVEHFVFALHLHAFAFLGFTVMALARHGAVLAAGSAWTLAYTFLALRRVYGEGVLRTGLKYSLLGLAYLLLLALALVGTLVATLALM